MHLKLNYRPGVYLTVISLNLLWQVEDDVEDSTVGEDEGEEVNAEDGSDESQKENEVSLHRQ